LNKYFIASRNRLGLKFSSNNGYMIELPPLVLGLLALQKGRTALIVEMTKRLPII